MVYEGTLMYLLQGLILLGSQSPLSPSCPFWEQSRYATCRVPPSLYRADLDLRVRLVVQLSLNLHLRIGRNRGLNPSLERHSRSPEHQELVISKPVGSEFIRRRRGQWQGADQHFPKAWASWWWRWQVGY